MDVLTSFSVVIVPQYIQVVNHHLKLTQCVIHQLYLNKDGKFFFKFLPKKKKNLQSQMVALERSIGHSSM